MVLSPNDTHKVEPSLAGKVVGKRIQLPVSELDLAKLLWTRGEDDEVDVSSRAGVELQARCKDAVLAHVHAKDIKLLSTEDPPVCAWG